MSKELVAAAALSLPTGVFGASAVAQTAAHRGTVEAGRRLALQTCDSCHIVATDHQIPPAAILSGPSFYDVANKADTTAQSLAAFLAVPHPYGRTRRISGLKPAQIDDLVSYILSLKGRH
jgi:mono/diheme cytochrome c family protein